MLNLKKIFLELEKIDRLYAQYNSFLLKKKKFKDKNNIFSDKILNIEEFFSQKKFKFEEKIKSKESKLLAQYSDEKEICKYLQCIFDSTKARYNVFFNNNRNIKLSSFDIAHKQYVDYSQYYEETRYQALLLYSYLANVIEKKGVPETHAFRLTIIFDSITDVLKYIFKNIKNDKPFYQICSIKIPDIHKCNFSAWRRLSQKYLHDDSFKKILPIAKEIEELVVKNNLGQHKKLNYQEIRDVKDKIETKNNIFKKITKKNYNRNNEKNNQRKQLIEDISLLRLELYHLSAGIKLENLDMPILMAYQEAYLKKTNADVYNYFLNHGLTKNDFFDKFLKLKRVDDDELIPKIFINGEKIGYPGYYLFKVPVLDDMHAARAACLGEHTRCCQSLGKAGESCVIHGLTRPDGGFYILCKGDLNNPKISDPILAQCWAWRSNKGDRGKKGAIGFDSIESAYDGEVIDIIEGAYDGIEIIKDFYIELANILVDNGHTEKVICGNTSWGEPLGIESSQNEKENIIAYDGNYDSEIQSVVRDINNPYYWYDTDNKYRIETERILMDSLAQKDPITSIKSLNLMLSWALSSNQESLLSKIKEVATQHNRIDELNLIIDKSKKYMKTVSYGKKEFTKIIDDGYLLFYIRNKNGDTPLFHAIKNNLVDSALKLIKMDAGIHLTNDDKTALHLACMGEPFNSEIILSLINHNVNVRADDYHEKTALHYILERKQVDQSLVDSLIKHGANLNARDYDGKTPLHIIATQANISPAVIDTIFENNVNPNIKDINDNTPLHIAIEYNHRSLFNKLIKYEVDLESQNFDGNSPIFLAIIHNNDFFMKKLLEKGANIHVVNKLGKNILHIAAEETVDLFFLEKFTTKNLNINEADILNRTPLHIACEQNEVDIEKIRILIEKGADINAQDIQGQTPLHSYISSRKDLDLSLINLLIENGTDIKRENIYGKKAIDLLKKEMNLKKNRDQLASCDPNKKKHLCNFSENQRCKTLLFSKINDQSDKFQNHDQTIHAEHVNKASKKNGVKYKI